MGKLTEDDLDAIDAGRNRLEDRVHNRYGFAGITFTKRLMVGSAGKRWSTGTKRTDIATKQ
jgi:hypothetical protein